MPHLQPLIGEQVSEKGGAVLVIYRATPENDDEQNEGFEGMVFTAWLQETHKNVFKEPR